MKIDIGYDVFRKELVLNFEYNVAIIKRLKLNLLGRRFDGETKTWRVSLAGLEELLTEFGAMLNFTYPYRELLKAREELSAILGNVDANISQKMKLPLYDYQVVGGTAFLPAVKKGILADQPGLGKTPQAFAGFTYLFERGLATKALVFCKTALKSQWLSELDKFTNFKGLKIEGDPEERELLYTKALEPDINFIIINYEYLIHNSAFIKKQRVLAEKQNKKARNIYNDFEKIKAIADHCQIIILDEAQKIKNASKIQQYMCKLDAEYKWCLTGTPIENKPLDLFNLCFFMDPSIFGYNPKIFKRHFYTGQYHDEINYKKLPELKQRIAPYMLRRSYDTVKGSFPELIPPQLVWLDPSYEQLAIHDDLKQITNKMLEAFNEGKETMVSIIGTFSLMLQVADTPELLKFSSSELGKKLFKKYFKDLKHIYSPKIEWVSDFIEERKINDLNAKTLLFTRSDDMAFLIKEELLQFYPECDIITFTGALSEAERDVCKKSFLNPSGAKVFISTDAGSEGLNLQVTDVEINIDLPFNPSRLAQRVGRLHRKGSTFSHVRVINLITKESIDERILDIIYQKQKLVDEVIEGNVVDVEMSSNLLKKLLAN